ncbi:hypothetical protein JXL21_10195 [Candidatus Bathyarchaeota archaeon]|nr:hypothetical protein [Candidatus Bathyarchaeota archaeon]
MRRYIDLHLAPEQGCVDEMIGSAAELGYCAVGCTLKPPPDPKVEVVSRLDIAPRNQQQLLSLLKKNRFRYEVISVLCLSKSVARQAAKDHRVDILRFPDDPHRRRDVWLDRHQAKLAGETNCCYEVDAGTLLTGEPTRLSHTITQIRRELENAHKHDIPVVLSSGAGTSYGMREPRALAALVALAGVDEKEAVEMISSNPWALVERNRDKLSDSFVSPGVWVMDNQ